MKEVKRVFSWMRGYKKYYLYSFIAVLIAQGFTLLSPLIIKFTIDNVLANNQIESKYLIDISEYLGGVSHLRKNIWILALLLIGANLIRGIFLFLRTMFASLATEKTIKTLRDQLYNHIQRLDYAYHSQADTGDLIQRSTSDIETIKRFISVDLVELLGSIVVLLFIVPMLFSLNVSLAWASIILLPFIFLFALYFFKRVTEDFSRVDEAEALMSSKLQENISGVRIVKAFNNQEYEIEEFEKKSKALIKDKNIIDKNLAKYWGISDFISMLQVGVMIVYGVILSYREELSLGEFTAFISYLNIIIWPIRQLGRTITDMGKARVAINRIGEILDQPIEELYESGKKPNIEGKISFSHLYFSYDGKSDILKDINFTINKGETLGIIGETGSGKSTLVSLLLRLYEYDRGHIKIDDLELNTIDKGWIRENIGIVLQEPFLYARTIKENIKFANPEIEDSTVYQAASQSHIHSDIKKLEEGYLSMVGEKGVSLSGGQKQRLAIARTIIEEKPIIIFDDSLSAVDTETDKSIRKSLNDLSSSTTKIIISHRIASIAGADLIILLEEGKIVARGRHEELLENSALYKELYQIQNQLAGEGELDVRE